MISWLKHFGVHELTDGLHARLEPENAAAYFFSDTVRAQITTSGWANSSYK